MLSFGENGSEVLQRGKRRPAGRVRRFGETEFRGCFVAGNLGKEFSGEKIADPEKEWQKLEKEGIKLLLRDDAGFPPALREIPFPPFGIYVLGEIPLSAPLVAVVGTRKATSYGLEAARKSPENFPPPALSSSAAWRWA